MLVYNYNVDQVYTFTDHDKALASIESSMRTYLAESEVEDDVYKHVIATNSPLSRWSSTSSKWCSTA